MQAKANSTNRRYRRSGSVQCSVMLAQYQLTGRKRCATDIKQQLFMQDSSPLKMKILADNNRVMKRDSSDVFRQSSPSPIPELSLRTYTSLKSADSTDQFRKKASTSSKTSNLTGLLSDFEQLRQNIRKMQSSNQRIVDKIQRSYDVQGRVVERDPQELPVGRVASSGVLGIGQIGPIGHPIGQGVSASGTNYRYEVEEVHHLEGLDQAYEINYLQNKVKDLNKRLQEQIGSASYYKFQVWMMKDLLRKNGIHPGSPSETPDCKQPSPPPNPSSPNLKLLLPLLQSHFTQFFSSYLQPKLQKIQQRCQVQMSRLSGICNTIDVQLGLKCSHMKTKQKFAYEPRKKLEQQLEDKEAKIKELQRNYQSKSDELVGFRDQVGAYLEKMRLDGAAKIEKLEATLKEADDKNRELLEKLKKDKDNQRKGDKARVEADRLNRLVDQLNMELELGNQKLAEKEAKLKELEGQLTAKQKIQKSLETQLKVLKQQLQQQKKTSKISDALDWLPMQSSVIQHLDSSQLIPHMVDKATATEILSDPLVSRLTQRVAELQTQLSSNRQNNSEIDRLTKKLQLSQQNNNKLREQLERARGDADRKMYKSVLNVESKLQVSEPGRDTRLESRIPRSKKYNSILREDSVFNTLSKVSGGKQISLNLSVDEDSPPFDLNIEDMISQPDYPFQKLRLTSSDSLFVIMKMAQLLRIQRDELRDKTRLLHFLRTRTDPNSSNLIQPIPDDDRIQMCDYGDTYTEVFAKKGRRRPNQWQQLERESMQAIEKLLEQVEGLQAELEKAERNQNNLIQMKELYKGEITKLTRMNEEYEIHYKDQVRRLTQMLQNYQHNKNLDGAKEIVSQIVRISYHQPEKLNSQQCRGYIHMLGELLSIKQ